MQLWQQPLCPHVPVVESGKGFLWAVTSQQDPLGALPFQPLSFQMNVLIYLMTLLVLHLEPPGCALEVSFLLS